jgi:hypothetical protein
MITKWFLLFITSQFLLFLSSRWHLCKKENLKPRIWYNSKLSKINLTNFWQILLHGVVISPLRSNNYHQQKLYQDSLPWTWFQMIQTSINSKEMLFSVQPCLKGIILMIKTTLLWRNTEFLRLKMEDLHQVVKRKRTSQPICFNQEIRVL